MTSHERLKVCGARVAKFGISLAHSIGILLAFWILLDLMQGQFRVPVKSFLSASTVSAPTPDLDGLAVRLHAYGYHAQKARDTQHTSVVMVPVTSTTCPQAKVVLAKSFPRPDTLKKPKVLMGHAPRALVKHMSPNGYTDARGPVNSYTRVDL